MYGLLNIFIIFLSLVQARVRDYYLLEMRYTFFYYQVQVRIIYIHSTVMTRNYESQGADYDYRLTMQASTHLINFF